MKQDFQPSSHSLLEPTSFSPQLPSHFLYNKTPTGTPLSVPFLPLYLPWGHLNPSKRTSEGKEKEYQFVSSHESTSSPLAHSAHQRVLEEVY